MVVADTFYRHGSSVATPAQCSRLFRCAHARLARSLHPSEGLFDESGNIGADSKQFLQGWMDRYVAWAKEHAA